MSDAELLEFVEDFKQELIDFGTYCQLPTICQYSETRKELLKCRYNELIPNFIKKCRTSEELWDFLQSKFHLSSERKTFFKKEFNPILDRLEKKVYLKNSDMSELKGKFSSVYIKQRIDLMNDLQESNPTETIGIAKELIESCCKTILEKLNVEYATNDSLTTLTKKTLKNLNLSPENIDEDFSLGQTLKQILGSLSSISSGMAELRNSYGTGHGKSDKYKELEPRHSKLAVGSATTLVTFLWDCYESQTLKK